MYEKTFYVNNLTMMYSSGYDVCLKHRKQIPSEALSLKKNCNVRKRHQPFVNIPTHESKVNHHKKMARDSLT